MIELEEYDVEERVMIKQTRVMDLVFEKFGLEEEEVCRI
jgi:hypothetical protein